MNRPLVKQRGVGMIEAMVALVVMSIGMLGIAALYIESTRANRTALVRTQAISLVNDMADRIRANRGGGVNYDTATYGGAPAQQGCIPPGGNCSQAALAQDDLARWIADVRATLPRDPAGNNPGSTVTFTAAAGAGPEQYQILVSWLEPGEQLPYSYQTTVQLLP